MKRSSPSALTILFCIVSMLVVAACDEEEVESTEEAAPLLSLFNHAVSRNNQGAEPTEAVRIEIDPTEYWVDGTKILDLTRGRPARGGVDAHVITALRDAIDNGSARRQAALSIHTNLPYLTFAETLHTLDQAGIHVAGIQVRDTEATPNLGWMTIRNWQVVEHGAEIEWTTESLSFDAFGEHWRAVYEACRAGQYIDCDAPYTNVAVGGTLGIELWTRGQSMKVTFSQATPPETEEGDETEGGGHVAMIEGVRPPDPVEEEEIEPADEGAFNLRQMEGAQAESAISNTVQPVCGNAACQFEVVSDATGLSMRVITFMGAVNPNGFTEPEFAFRLPQ